MIIDKASDLCLIARALQYYRDDMHETATAAQSSGHQNIAKYLESDAEATNELFKLIDKEIMK